MTKAKATTDVDQVIAERLRIRRTEIGMSQTKLATLLGMTYQNIQKYEQCSMRISASRLVQAANALGVTPSYFYEGLRYPTPLPAVTDRPLVHKDHWRLMMLFRQIDSDHMRRAIVALARAAAEEM